MLTEREFDELRVYHEERLEREFTDIQRFYLGERAEVVEGKPEQPPTEPIPQESE